MVPKETDASGRACFLAWFGKDEWTGMLMTRRVVRLLTGRVVHKSTIDVFLNLFLIRVGIKFFPR